MAVLQDRAAVVAAHSTTEPLISFIIPVLNDRMSLDILLPQLQGYREKGHELLLVDGGSNDGSVSSATGLVDRILMTGPGRARQMNLGADNAKHDILQFVHADSRLPDDLDSIILKSMQNPERLWGRFDVSLDENGFAYVMIAFMMNLRSRLSGVATGDQGIFVRKTVFHETGGFKDIPLMEDVAISKILRKKSWPVCLKAKIITSARRWKQKGVLRTILMMWYLRLAYFMGADPVGLAAIYYPQETSDGDSDRRNKADES